MSDERWHKVTKAAPCNACGKPDWCAWTPRQGRVLDALADFAKANRRRRPKSPPEKNLGNMLTT